MKNKFIYLLLLCFGFLQAQELKCTVKVGSEQIQVTNKQIFKTLERQLTDFVNNTSWTNRTLNASEKISCSMFINVSAFDNDSFTATIQVQSSRPIFDSNYSSSIFNYNDKEFNFSYTEYQNLNYNPNMFDSNLVSVISFYSLMIIGIDADTFSLNGGSEYLETAREIANVAQSSGFAGWTQSNNTNSRYYLINDMLSNTFSAYRKAMFQFHFAGLDTMTKDTKAAKEVIKNSLLALKELHNIRPNAFITRTFFDAKTDEIVSIFSGGPFIATSDLVDNLNRISPLNSSKWSAIKN